MAAEQRVSLDGEIASLGNGVFVTAAGDAWYRYSCKKILVYAKQLPACYAALPVIVTKTDRNYYFSAKGTVDDNNTQFFITPHSHLLTTTGIELDCVPEVAPVYRGSTGKWLRASPTLTEAVLPTILEPSGF